MFISLWKKESQQQWLEYMAKQGWHLKKVKYPFVKFEKGEGKDTRYRIDYCAEPKTNSEKNDFYKEAGWNYIDNHQGVHYFEAKDSETIELHTDINELFNELEVCEKLIKKGMWIQIVWLLLLSVVMLFMMQPLYLNLIEGGNLPLVIILILFGYMLLYKFLSLRFLKQRKKQLINDGALNTKSAFKKDRIKGFLNNCIVAFLIVSCSLNMIISLYSESGKLTKNTNIDDAIHLYELQPNLNSTDYYSSYSKNKSLIAPIQIETTEYTKDYFLSNTVYQIRLPFVLDGFLREKIDEKQSQSYEIKYLDFADFEQLILLEPPYKQWSNLHLIGITDNTYYEISYNGEVRLEEIIDHMIMKIEELNE